MAFHSFVLYVLPVLSRFAIQWPGSAEQWGDVVLSFLPLIVVLPSLLLPKVYKTSMYDEHVVRHAIYAFAFTVSVAASVRWDVILPALQTSDDVWAIRLVAYLVVGSITLWWFCLSHIWENRVSRGVHTHQGDVAVLPLTLVAIATFAYQVPDEAFRWSRSVIYFVPVIVAWATLHFIAYNEFAVSRTTTYDKPLFSHLAQSGLVVGVAQLVLLETRAPPFSSRPSLGSQPSCANSRQWTEGYR